MTYKKALKIAIKAMELEKRKHEPNANAYYIGCPGSKGEATKYEDYCKAIELLEEVHRKL